MPSRVTFFFHNRRLEGIEGESIAKALFRAGIRTLSYSVKYRRPRSIHCARGRCVMCHMEVDGVTGVPTCITPLRAGVRVNRESFRPFFAPLLTAAVRILPFPAGFYYRMFTRPAIVRELFLGTLRRMAGVGRVVIDKPAQPRPHGDGPSDVQDLRHVSGKQETPQPPNSRERQQATTKTSHLKNSYDIIVVGAGLSGMSAAVSAARQGSDVLLIDEYGLPGGHSIGFDTDNALTGARDKLIREMLSLESLSYCPQTTAQAFYPPGRLLLGPGGALAHGTPPASAYTEATGRPGDPRPAAGHRTKGRRVSLGGTMKTVSAPTYIFATGAYDIVPLFANNDLPGVFGARAMRLLLERDSLRPGKRAVVFGAGAALESAASLLQHHSIEIAALVDASPAGNRPAGLAQGASYHPRARMIHASGRHWLSSVAIENRGGAGRTKIACDILCTTFAGQGAYELPYQAGFSLAMSEDPIEENRVMLPCEHEIRMKSADTSFGVGEPASFSLAMSEDPIEENRVMLPCEHEQRTESATTCFVVGELAGERNWHAKIKAGETAAKRATESLREQ